MNENSAGKRRGRPRPAAEVSLAGSRDLDRASSIPLYYQLAEALKQALEVGAWKAGARFPTEREIKEVFGVSRTVIRPALDLLVGDGAIFRVRGKGTFVAPPKREVPVVGYSKAATGGLGELTLKVLAAGRRSPDRMVTHFLRLTNPETPVGNVTAMMQLDGRSICYLDSYFLISYLPWLLPSGEEHRQTAAPNPPDLELTHAKAWLEGTYLGQFAASHFEVSAGDPGLLGRLVQFARPGAGRSELPVEFARLISPGDSTQLVFEAD